jgi:hypothetical protein
VLAIPSFTRTELITRANMYPTQPFLDIPSAEEVSVLAQAGARIVTGMKLGTAVIPVPSGASAGWLDESLGGSEGTTDPGGVQVSPKILYASRSFSVNFLRSSNSVEFQRLIIKMLIEELWAKLEATILGKAAGSIIQPPGAFYVGASVPAVAITAPALLTMESALYSTKCLPGTYAYFTNEPGSRKIKTAASADTCPSRPLYRDGKLSDHPLFITNGVATGVGAAGTSEGLLFARISDLFIGQCGPYMITVDPVTKIRSNSIRLIIQGYFLVTGFRAADENNPYTDIFTCAAI